MNVGIGLPSWIPGTAGPEVLGWAKRAEEKGFSSLGVVDRIGYGTYDPHVTLAAAAAVTTSVKLVTMVVIAPLRSPASLAKEAAAVQALSDGRLIMGLAVGARTEDYVISGIPSSRRGEQFTSLLEDLPDAWATTSPSLGPMLPELPPVLLGGSSDIALGRAAALADGYVHGGGPPRLFERAVKTVTDAWYQAGRSRPPLLWAQAYFALGDEDEIDRGRARVRDYYRFTGPFADRIAEGVLATPHAIAQFVRGYSEAGCDELVLLPSSNDRSQVDRLADILGRL